MGKSEYERVRRIALALPGVSERSSGGAPCFFVQDKKPLCRYHDHHRGDERISLWCPAEWAVRDALLSAQPERFFKPQPSASGTFGGWVGVYLDTPPVDWAEVAELLDDAFRLVAPKKLVAQLEGD